MRGGKKVRRGKEGGGWGIEGEWVGKGMGKGECMGIVKEKGNEDGGGENIR